MANLTRLLGMLMASGVAGRSRRGMGFGRSGMGLGRSGKGMALITLGSVAYSAWQSYQARQQPAGGGATGATGGQGQGQSLGDRLAGMIPGMGEQRAAAPQLEPEPSMDDDRALLLIRAMITAANADGEISPEERQRITSQLESAGADAEDRQVLEQELARPRSVEEIGAAAGDQETAEEIYLASRLAIEPDTPADRSYLGDLAGRLGIPADRQAELDRAA
jgi:uncharacterized membrane protein YebE (DUF533 family)